MKRIPYGIASFIGLRRDNSYYVDKTDFIRNLEEAGKFLMLIRPRRMGKSLLVNTLAAYYNLNHRDRFEEYFGGTKIAENPTELIGSFFVLRFDFSRLEATPERIQVSFDNYGRECLQHFWYSYETHFGADFQQELFQRVTFLEQFSYLLSYFARTQRNLYLLIDEYDNFTNTILTLAGHQSYLEITKATGFYRAFFALIKSAAGAMEGGEIRLFITGVSPVTMDDVTSGFNIGINLSLDPGFQELLGFTEAEVRTLVDYYKQQGVFPLDPAVSIALLKNWYDNYRFSASAETSIFNSDMVLYFVSTAIRQKGLPSSLIDQNIRIDYGKLRFLLMEAKKLNGNFERLRDLIITEKPIHKLIATSFPAEKIAYPENFISLLYYFGLITYQDPKLGEEQLIIPNQTVRQLMIGYLIEGFDEGMDFRPDFSTLRYLLKAMAYSGEWRPFFDWLASQVQAHTTIRDYLTGEKIIQGFLLAYLANAGYYVVGSEFEAAKGFADFFLQSMRIHYPEIRYSYLIEVKFIARKGSVEKLLPQKIREAQQQLAQYEQDSKLKRLSDGTELKKLLLVFHGWELVRREELEI